MTNISSKSTISLEPLRKALSTLTEVLHEPFTFIVRDATIQRFEYTFELSWKLLKRYFAENNSLIESNVKNLFREAGKQGLIDDVEQWFNFLRCRNLTSHTYVESTAQEVYESAKAFEQEAVRLLTRMEQLVD